MKIKTDIQNFNYTKIKNQLSYFQLTEKNWKYIEKNSLI